MKQLALSLLLRLFDCLYFRFNTVSVLNSKAIQYRNRIKFLQATVPFVRRFCSDSSEQLEEVYQRKMTDPIIARLV